MAQHHFVAKILKQFDTHQVVTLSTLPCDKLLMKTRSNLWNKSNYVCINYQKIHLRLSNKTFRHCLLGSSVFSRFISVPRKIHLEAVKHILLHLKMTQNLHLYTMERAWMLMWSGSDAKGRRSTSGYLFRFGKGLITRSSKRQPARHWSRHWKGFRFPLWNNPICQLGSIWSKSSINNNSSFSLLMSVLKPWQTSQKQNTEQTGKRRNKERWTKSEPKEQNPKWVTKWQKNKSCSRDPFDRYMLIQYCCLW